MIVFATLWFLCTRVAQGSVLDPALYLLPSPPMAPTSGEGDPGLRWSQGAERVEREADQDLTVLPIEKLEQETEPPLESMEKAETIWPSLRAGSLGIRSLHVPLTFAITGNYGRYGSPGNAGLIGSSYGVIPAAGVYGKSALAGSGYTSYGPTYGARIYGGTNTASWSGWGNGKWGHYGKG